MTLEAYCESLNNQDLLNLAYQLCNQGLSIWESYTLENNLTYRDTVVGMFHEVRPDLLRESVDYCGESIKQNRTEKKKKFFEEFRDPVVALQDLDWELPENVEYIFYAVYNLMLGLEKRDRLTISIKQAASGLEGIMTIEEIRYFIYASKSKN